MEISEYFRKNNRCFQDKNLPSCGSCWIGTETVRSRSNSSGLSIKSVKTFRNEATAKIWIHLPAEKGVVLKVETTWHLMIKIIVAIPSGPLILSLTCWLFTFIDIVAVKPITPTKCGHR